MSNLSDISILLRTFLRDEKLFNSISTIRKTMPEAQLIIVDDGDQTEEKSGIYADLIREGHEVLILDFDSGFGTKSNAGVSVFGRPYILISSDDFSHGDPCARLGIEKMLEVLDWNSELSIASGRVNNNPYERHLFEYPKGSVKETELWFAYPEPRYRKVDLTVNYCLVRREVFTKVRWDDDVKIGGGEHAAWFYDIMKAGFKVGWVPGVNINAQEGSDSLRYKQFRYRACRPERECFERRGIKRYVLADGTVDYVEKEAL